jgi:carnitine O-acetyltransferase
MSFIANNRHSLNFNIVCKRLGAERMSYYLNEAASDMRDMLMPDLLAESEKAKL